MALGEYFSALDSVVADLERMWRGLIEGRGGAREAGVKDLSTLVDVGLGGLVQLFLQIVRDGASRLLDPDNLIASGKFYKASQLIDRSSDSAESLSITANANTYLHSPPSVYRSSIPTSKDEGAGSSTT